MKLLLIFLLTLSRILCAAERLGPKNLEELGPAEEDVAYRVPATVTFVDREGMALDYPEVAEAIQRGKVKSWESWIIENFAVMSGKQMELSGFNTPITRLSETPIPLYRDASGGRSANLVAKLNGKPVGLINMKGIGNPKQATGLSGLLPHPAAISETKRQRYIQRQADKLNATDHAPRDVDYQTQAIRFVLAYEFDVLGTHTRARASAIGRQAVTRDHEELSPIPKELGIGADRHSQQTSKSGALMDFGNTTVDHPSFADSHPVLDSQFSENDLADRGSREAAERFEKGDKQAVTQHLQASLPNDFPAKEAIASMNRLIMEGQQAALRGETSDEKLLFTFLHLNAEVVSDRLSFSLAAAYQRDPALFEKHLEFMEKEIAIEKEISQQFEAIEQGIMAGQVERNKAKYDDFARQYDALARTSWVHGTIARRRAERVRAFRNQGLEEDSEIQLRSVAERAHDLVFRAMLDWKIFPYGSRYHSDHYSSKDVMTPADISSRAVLFVQRTEIEHMRSDQQRHFNSTFSDLKKTNPALAELLPYAMARNPNYWMPGHPLDEVFLRFSLPEPGPLDRVATYNFLEMLKRLNRLLDELPTAELNEKTLDRAHHFATFLQSVERWLANSQWGTSPIRRELTKTAIRLGSRAPAALEEWQAIPRNSVSEALENQGEHYRSSAQSLYHRMLGLEAVMKKEGILDKTTSAKPDIDRMRTDWAGVFDTNVRAVTGPEEERPDGGFVPYEIQPVKPWFPRLRAFCKAVTSAASLLTP